MLKNQLLSYNKFNKKMIIAKSKIKKQEFRNVNGISGKVKKFDESMHEKYDLCVRTILKNILGESIKDNEDIYGEDMIFTIKPFPYKYLEIQVCATWEDDYPYQYPFVYSRKMKFSEKTLFITFNKYYSKVIIFAKKYISEESSKLKKYDREHVNYVPWGKAMKFNTCDLTLNTIRRYSGEYIDSESDEKVDINIDDIK